MDLPPDGKDQTERRTSFLSQGSEGSGGYASTSTLPHHTIIFGMALPKHFFCYYFYQDVCNDKQFPSLIHVVSYLVAIRIEIFNGIPLMCQNLGM